VADVVVRPESEVTTIVLASPVDGDGTSSEVATEVVVKSPLGAAMVPIVGRVVVDPGFVVDVDVVPLVRDAWSTNR
jgi:hypothetical protein